MTQTELGVFESSLLAQYPSDIDYALIPQSVCWAAAVPSTVLGMETTTKQNGFFFLVELRFSSWEIVNRLEKGDREEVQVEGEE